jgi:hypothetical protein
MFISLVVVVSGAAARRVEQFKGKATSSEG